MDIGSIGSNESERVGQDRGFRSDERENSLGRKVWGWGRRKEGRKGREEMRMGIELKKNNVCFEVCGGWW